jgi:hypothetical protein
MAVTLGNKEKVSSSTSAILKTKRTGREREREGQP